MMEIKEAIMILQDDINDLTYGDDEVESSFPTEREDTYKLAIATLRKVDEGQLAEVVRGEWVDNERFDEHYGRSYGCGVCCENTIGKPNFCPNCGADMRGKKMRLIDADVLDVEKIDCSYGSECHTDDVQEWINEAPTINDKTLKELGYEKVVRCEDCEFGEKYHDKAKICKKQHDIKDGSCFCSEGKKRG